MNGRMPDVNKLMAYEQGELSEDETVELFQELVDSGLVWEMQGSYGRMAALLIRAGRVTVKRYGNGNGETSTAMKV